jgi:hypothetical protein
MADSDKENEVGDVNTPEDGLETCYPQPSGIGEDMPMRPKGLLPRESRGQYKKTYLSS